MIHPTVFWKTRGAPGAAAALLIAIMCTGIAALSRSSAATGEELNEEARELFDPRRPPEAELAMSIADDFTLATVGDCIISRPLSHLRTRDGAFDAVVKILRHADAAFGNLETSIIDIRHFEGHPHSGEGDWGLTTLPAVAGDLAAMGFDLFSRANNHVLDWGMEGMRETGRRLDEAGIVHAGAGEDRAAARAARYFESEKGRIGLVSMASTYGALAAALAPAGESPGRPGLSALRVKRYTIVPHDVMGSLAGIDRAIREFRGDGKNNPGKESDAGSGAESPDELSLFGIEFRLGKRFAYRYEMNGLDLAEILKSIRLGKQHSDFLIATIHAHQSAFDRYAPGGFLQELARAAIDAGADAFITHGIHHLGPIEVYEGKPIFYGLANFFWSDIQEPLAPDLHEAYRDLIAKAFLDP
ncbi:MAG: CapA family protein, partial [Acidobacteria bacterium]|nr:CapA family protein [Acidobacteriota bacterium]